VREREELYVELPEVSKSIEAVRPEELWENYVDCGLHKPLSESPKFAPMSRIYDSILH